MRRAKVATDPIKTWRVIRGDYLFIIFFFKVSCVASCFSCSFDDLGDRVEVMTGKHRGQRGEIKQVLRKQNKVIVEGVNLAIKHQAGTGELKGGKFTKEAPIHVSNVSLKKCVLFPFVCHHFTSGCVD